MSATGFTPQELLIIIKIILILKLIITKLYSQKYWLSNNLAILLQIGHQIHLSRVHVVSTIAHNLPIFILAIPISITESPNFISCQIYQFMVAATQVVQDLF